jgi:hypothetical protein
VRLFITTFDDYVWAFKQSTLYRQYLQGGPFGHGLNKNELLLKRAQMSHELISLVATIENYKDGSSFMIHFPPLEGEKVFGLAKHCVNCPHGANHDSHRVNNVNFSHL